MNTQDRESLGHFVANDVEHNGRALGLAGYRQMLENDLDAISDWQFNIELLVAYPPSIASRLRFECSPAAAFMGLSVNGQTISFADNVFHECRNSTIA